MSEIPSQIASSVAPTSYQAREVTKEREARSAVQAEGDKNQVKAIDEASETVDTEESDVAVFSDAEGAGSEGRSDEEEAGKQDGDGEGAEEGDASDDDENRPRLDIRA